MLIFSGSMFTGVYRCWAKGSFSRFPRIVKYIEKDTVTAIF